MTGFDDLWFLAEDAAKTAERVEHDLRESHDPTIEPALRRSVSRRRFRTLAERIRDCGSPFGAHTIVHRNRGEFLLVRHAGLDRWVLPGGGVDGDEGLRAAAERELAEEAGVGADYEGLGALYRVEVTHGDHETWGVMPVYAARAEGTSPTAADPDGEITAAQWFRELPRDTRDREDLLAWRRRRFGEE